MNFIEVNFKQNYLQNEQFTEFFRHIIIYSKVLTRLK